MNEMVYVRVETWALVRATPLSIAFHWIDARRARLPGTSVPRLIEFVVMTFGLTRREREWLTWSLEPHTAALAPKEPAPLRL